MPENAEQITVFITIFDGPFPLGPNMSYPELPLKKKKPTHKINVPNETNAEFCEEKSSYLFS